jgi:hypothetical protein
VANLDVTGKVESTADQVGAVLAGAAAVGVAAHAGVTALRRARETSKQEKPND